MIPKVANTVNIRASVLSIIFLFGTCLIIPFSSTVQAFTWEEPVDVPVWMEGDYWTYWTLSNEDLVESEEMAGLTLTLTFQHLSDNTTYEVLPDIFNEEGHDCYKQTMDGESDFYGLYDISGLANENGWFTGNSTTNGFVYRRTSDLALVKSEIEITESMTFFDENTGQVSALLGSIDGGGNSVLVANPPVNDLKFPLSTGQEWDTQSTVTTTTTVPGQNPTQSTTVYNFHNEVMGIESHSVEAGTFESFKIYQVGTSSTDGNQKNIDQNMFFSTEAKNIIEKVDDGEVLKDYSVRFSPDLTITDEEINIRPETPSLDLTAKVNATIRNVGHENSGNFKAELWVGSEVMDELDISSIPNGGHENVTFEWTPDEIGYFTVEVRLDTDSDVTEYLEDNNAASIEVEVTEPRPDLSIRGSYIDAPAEVPVETTATIEFSVHNDGNKEATDVEIQVLDGADPIGEVITIDIIDADDHGQTSISWTPETKGFHTIIVIVDPDDAISELSESNNDASIVVNVMKPDHSFNMKFLTSLIEIEPNRTVEEKIEIKNTGNEDDTVDLELLSVPAGWLVDLSKYSVDLSSGRKETVTISVTSPPDAMAEQELEVAVDGTSRGDATFKQSLNLPIDVVQAAGISFEQKTDADSLMGDPGDTVTCRFHVFNRGNAADIFDLSVRSDKQWDTSIDGEDVTKELAPGEYDTVTVETVIPETATGGDENEVTLSAVSQFDPDLEGGVTVSIGCIRLQDLTLSLAPLTMEMEPQSTASFAAMLTNNGNVPEEVTLSLNSTPEFPDDWVVNLFPDTMVDPGETEYVNFTIRAPHGARAVKYDIILEATTAEEVLLAEEFTLTVLRMYKLGVEVVLPQEEIKAGEGITCTVTVTNRGNEEETIALSVPDLDPAFTVSFEEDEITLAPGESRDVALTIEIDEKAKGTYEIAVRGAIGGEAANNYDLTLDVTKRPEASPGFWIILVVMAIVAMAALVRFRRW